MAYDTIATVSAKATLADAMAVHGVSRLDDLTREATLACLSGGRAAFFNAGGYQNQFAANAILAAMSGQCDLFYGEHFDGLADYFTVYAREYRDGLGRVRQYLHTIVPLNDAAHIELARIHKMLAAEAI